MKIDCLYFHSHPYTSPEAQQKVESLAKRLAIYGVGTHLNIVPFTEVQQCIRDNSPPDYASGYAAHGDDEGCRTAARQGQSDHYRRKLRPLQARQ